MRKSDHFPRLTITSEQSAPGDLAGRESVDAYLARGGTITVVPFGVSGEEFSLNRSVEEVRAAYRERGYKITRRAP